MKRPDEILDALGNNKTMSEVIFEHLKWEIITGRIASGERLVERDLTERFNVSRTPLREALKQLVRTQLAVDIPYRGVVVRTLAYEFVRDIYDLRLGTEGLSAFLAAKRGSRDEIDGLQDAYDRIESAAQQGDRDAVLFLNAEFHAVIARATHNELLVERVNELWTHINIVRGASWVGNRRTDPSRREHQAIIEAIAARNPERARAAMEEHILSSWAVVEERLKRQERERNDVAADEDGADAADERKAREEVSK